MQQIRVQSHPFNFGNMFNTERVNELESDNKLTLDQLQHNNQKK